MKWTDRWQAYGSAAAGFGGLGSLVFAGLLFWVTRQQAAIGERQTRISERQAGAERAYLFPIIEHNFDELFAGFRLYSAPGSWPKAAQPYVNLKFMNYGRSPAILADVLLSVHYSSSPMDDAARHVQDLPEKRVIAPQETSRTWQISNPPFMVSFADYQAMLTGRMCFWVNGSAIYEETAGTRRCVHFCWRFDATNHVFAPYSDQRNYTEEVPSRTQRAAS